MFQTRCDSQSWMSFDEPKQTRGMRRALRASASALDKPATTIPASVVQARAALRAFRECIKDGAVQKPDPDLPYCCQLRVPQPHPGEEDAIQLLQDGEFPGGVLQKFRKLRPAVDDLLSGYEPEFVGMVPDPGDGVGVWRCTADPGMSVICNANTLTLETLIDLCEGKYGPGPTRPDHVVVAVNCTWTTGDDVGQFWQRELKQRATAVIEERVWHDVYHLAPLKTMSGATGWLYHAWGNPWKVYSCEDDEARQLGGVLKAFSEAWAAGGESLRPESSEVAELLGAAADERDPRRKVIRLL